MSAVKIAITMDQETLDRIDQLVESGMYPNCSRAIRDAVAEKIARIDHRCLAAESAKLDPDFENGMAEEGLNHQIESRPE